MSDSTHQGGSTPDPVSWEQPPTASLALSPLEMLDGADLGDIVPAASAPRSKRPWIIGTAAATVLVLVGGGIAAALILNRPDVQLQRALSATTEQPTGSMTMSVKVTGVSDSAAQSMIDGVRLRLAWDKTTDTQQCTVAVNKSTVLDIVAAPDSVILTQGLTSLALPEIESILGGFRDFGSSLGPDGRALVDFSRGVPLRIATGPGSAFGKLLKDAESTAARSSNAPDEAKVQAVADKIQQSIRDHVTVTEEGSDDAGDHLRAVVPVKAVVSDVAPMIADLVGQPVPSDLLSSIKGDPQMTVDVWVKDGMVSKLEIPLGQLMRDSGTASAPDITVVMVMSRDGVKLPPDPIADLPDSVFENLGGGLLDGLAGLAGRGGLGGLGGFGATSGDDSAFTIEPAA